MPDPERELALRFKQALGPLQAFDCTNMDILAAHHRLGAAARGQIWRTLARRLDLLESPARTGRQMSLSRQVRHALETRLQNEALDRSMREALRTYRGCLAAWAHGAGLDEFKHPSLPAGNAEAEDLAVFLQEDEVGCQTGTLRGGAGEVILWHTEEDTEGTPGERFDSLRLFSYRAHDGAVACAFIYPDLLPGPSFGWQTGGFCQAVDTLHVKTVDFENALLPNTLAWLSLYLGAGTPRAALAAQLGPWRGGYSLTAAARQDGRMEVEKVEFANDAWHASHLGHAPGSVFFQTNIIQDLSLQVGGQEQTSPESRAWNQARLARTSRLLPVLRATREPLPLVFRLLRSRLGGESAYANHDVKASLVCRLAPDGMQAWVGGGMPMPGEELFSVEIRH